MLSETEYIPLCLGISDQVLSKNFVLLKYLHSVFSLVRVILTSDQVNGTKRTFTKLFNNFELLKTEFTALHLILNRWSVCIILDR